MDTRMYTIDEISMMKEFQVNLKNLFESHGYSVSIPQNAACTILASNDQFFIPVCVCIPDVNLSTGSVILYFDVDVFKAKDKQHIINNVMHEINSFSTLHLQDSDDFNYVCQRYNPASILGFDETDNAVRKWYTIEKFLHKHDGPPTFVTEYSKMCSKCLADIKARLIHDFKVHRFQIIDDESDECLLLVEGHDHVVLVELYDPIVTKTMHYNNCSYSVSVFHEYDKDLVFDYVSKLFNYSLGYKFCSKYYNDEALQSLSIYSTQRNYGLPADVICRDLDSVMITNI